MTPRPDAPFGPEHPEWCPVGNPDEGSNHAHCGHWYECEPCHRCGDDTPDPNCDCDRCTAPRSTPAPSPSQPEPGTRRHLPDCPLPRLIASCTCPTPPAPPAVPGDRPDTAALAAIIGNLWDYPPESSPSVEQYRQHLADEFGEDVAAAWDRLTGPSTDDADAFAWRLAPAQPAHPAPDGEPGSLHLGAEDRFHLWAHINTIHQETAPTQRGLTEITFDHVHEEAACALAYFDPAPPGGYGVADGTAT